MSVFNPRCGCLLSVQRLQSQLHEQAIQPLAEFRAIVTYSTSFDERRQFMKRVAGGLVGGDAGNGCYGASGRVLLRRRC